MSAASARLETLRARARRLPTGPGVYVFEDEAGRVLYVGKASNLRTRVATYLRGGDERPLVRLLLRRAADVRVVSTGTAEEALLYENTLIKKEKPPYNLRLKDDKSYLLVRVDRSHAFPRLSLVRRVKKDGALYLGPFASAKGIRRTLRFLRTMYPLRSCSDRELQQRTRPCLYHQIGRCAAPCVGRIDEASYARLVEEAVAVLRGRGRAIAKRLQEDMAAASADLLFERAAVLRDRLAALDASLERQDTVHVDGQDRDVVALAAAGGVTMVAVFYVRDGHVTATRALPHRTTLPRREVLTTFLSLFYANGKIVPPEILVGEEPVDPEGLAEALSAVRGAPVVVRTPQRGAARALLDLTRRHAEEALAEHSARAKEAHAALERLAEVLDLAGPPERIEGYDLSHWMGAEPVAAMSVLVGGVADPSRYRHFAVQGAAGGDDYAGMREVLVRRFARGEALGAWPDLVMVDGGRGQVEAARRALSDVGAPPVPVVGLAKARPERGIPDERIVRPDRAAPVILPPTDPALRLLVKVRDEAHRFAGRYQKKRRQMAMAEGTLDHLKGIGPARRRMLLQRFGSIAGLRAASFEDLAALPGIGAHRARRIRDRLAEAGPA